MSLCLSKFGQKLLCSAVRFLSNPRAAVSTIYALSSGSGKCGVAVIRISGEQALTAVKEIACLKPPIPERQAILRKLRDPVTREVLDKGIVLWFPGPRSFTGEDSCEFQVHGGPAVISAILAALSKLKGFCPAEPGEFTKRAFYAGKLDLTEVEGLADLIHAETEAQRKQALLQAEGTLSKLYNSWRTVLLKCIAHVEAFIDFSEDENIEDDVMLSVDKQLQKLKLEIQAHLKDGRKGEILRNGVRVSIVGEPNVGKSSFLNALSQRPAAIVTPFAGTTRDIVELQLNVKGYPVLLADTAGLRNHTDDVIEKEGILRARKCVLSSDLILLIIDANQALSFIDSKSASFEQFMKLYISHLCLTDILNGSHILDNDYKENKCIVIMNKTDLVNDVKRLQTVTEQFNNVLSLSCTTEEGFPEFLNYFAEILGKLCGNPTRECPTITQSRYRHHLEACLKRINQYTQVISGDGEIVLAAQELRSAVRHIGNITGHISTEQILDVIFRDFCIGK